MLEEGRYRSAAEVAEADGVTRSFVNRLLRLTLLAPNIVEAILDGRQPKGLQLEDVTRAMPITWDEQRQRFSDDRWTAAEELGSILSVRRTAGKRRRRIGEARQKEIMALMRR
jgi:hypothetical protein